MSDKHRISWLNDFIIESNLIEGVTEEPSYEEYFTYAGFIQEKSMSEECLKAFVNIVAPGNKLRYSGGQNVYVGMHKPLAGGSQVRDALLILLHHANQQTGTAFEVHYSYENLHPFTDGNGRSGRALWLWMMMQNSHSRGRVNSNGFLQEFYYQTLGHIDRKLKNEFKF